MKTPFCAKCVKALSPETGITTSSAATLLSKAHKQEVAQFLCDYEGTGEDFIRVMCNVIPGFPGHIYVSQDYELRKHRTHVDNAFPDYEWLQDVKMFKDKIPDRRSSRALLLRFQLISATRQIIDACSKCVH